MTSGGNEFAPSIQSFFDVDTRHRLNLSSSVYKTCGAVRTCGVWRTSRWRDRCHRSPGWDSWGGKNTHTHTHTIRTYATDRTLQWWRNVRMRSRRSPSSCLEFVFHLLVLALELSDLHLEQIWKHGSATEERAIFLPEQRAAWEISTNGSLPLIWICWNGHESKLTSASILRKQTCLLDFRWAIIKGCVCMYERVRPVSSKVCTFAPNVHIKCLIITFHIGRWRGRRSPYYSQQGRQIPASHCVATKSRHFSREVRPTPSALVALWHDRNRIVQFCPPRLTAAGLTQHRGWKKQGRRVTWFSFITMQSDPIQQPTVFLVPSC